MIRILFVCHANLCRSPMAEAVMTYLIREAGLAELIRVDSAGTHCNYSGAPAFGRAVEVLSEHGIASANVARQLEYDDLNTFDYVLAMDRRNLTFMLRHSVGCSAEIGLFLQAARQAGLVSREEVYDPYPNGDFQEAFDVIHAGCAAFLNQLRAKHQLNQTPSARE